MQRLKLYSDQDSEFKVYTKFENVVFPKREIVVSTYKGYLCITHRATEPNHKGQYLVDQFEMSLPLLTWFLGVKARFSLSPSQGGYPAGEMSDLAQLDSDNEVYVYRGANFANRGLMMFSLENRKRASYMLNDLPQSHEIYDVFFDNCGLLDTFLEIQKDYEDGLI